MSRQPGVPGSVPEVSAEPSSPDPSTPHPAPSAPTYSKQEQEPAGTQIEELAPNVLRIQLPVNLQGLGHVNCYVLEDSRGAALVDPGLPDDESWAALQQRLAEIGIPARRIHTTIATHSHVDHFGGVHRLREENDTDLLTHRSFRRTMPMREIGESIDMSSLELNTDEDLERLRERFRRPTPWGGYITPPDDSLRNWVRNGSVSFSRFDLPDPTIRVEDAEVVELAGREWIAVHTPGHTEDHLCLYDPVEQLMLSGDHVLPTITPHIGGISGHPDPLAAFFTSLARMHEFPTRLVLPAHGHPFRELGERADHICQHHLERLDILRHASVDIGDGTVNDYMQRLFRERSWGHMAESETYAHLEHLRLLGQATVGERDGLRTYTVTG